MANFHKFKCTFDGTGRYGVGGNSYANGDIFVLTEDNVSRWIKTSDILRGNIEYMGEVEGNDAYVSANMTTYLNGKPGVKKNVMSAAVVPLASAKTVAVQGEDIASNIALTKRVTVDKLVLSMNAIPTSTAAANTPRLLATAGAFEPKTPTTLRYYDDSTTTYGAITNGSMTNAAPITWAANDLMIVGYTEKFSSVNPTHTTAATAGMFSAAYYWNGSSWTSFDSFTDYTKEPGATNSFDRAGLETNTRVTWWEKPEDWKVGGPDGSGCGVNDYCVALKVNGVLTTLAGGALWVLTDTPLCDIGLGARLEAFDALVVVDGTGPVVYTDFTTEAGNSTADDVVISLAAHNALFGATAATDAIYFGNATKFGGMDINMGVMNDVASTINLYYWTGARWSAVATVLADGWGGTVADGTTGAVSFDQDGRITWLQSPPDWTADTAASVTGLGANTPTTVTTEALYWVKLTVTSVGIKTATAATQIWALPPTNCAIEFNCTPQSYVGANEDLHVYVIDEDASATLTIKAVVADI